MNRYEIIIIVIKDSDYFLQLYSGEVLNAFNQDFFLLHWLVIEIIVK